MKRSILNIIKKDRIGTEIIQNELPKKEDIIKLIRMQYVHESYDLICVVNDNSLFFPCFSMVCSFQLSESFVLYSDHMSST